MKNIDKQEIEALIASSGLYTGNISVDWESEEGKSLYNFANSLYKLGYNDGIGDMGKFFAISTSKLLNR